MPDRRPQHASSETNMPHRRPTCLIGDPSETEMLGQRPTFLIKDLHICLIGDTSETDMHNQRPNRDRHAL